LSKATKKKTECAVANPISSVAETGGEGKHSNLLIQKVFVGQRKKRSFNPKLSHKLFHFNKKKY
jgi:hypothetical protein